MAIEIHADDMLIPLIKSFESDTPTMHTLFVNRRDMTNQYCHSTLLFKFSQLALKPR